MLIEYADMITLVPLRNFTAICSKCEGKRTFLCFAIFESRCTRFVCGIDVTVVSYECFNVIHRQIGTTISCTVSGVRQNHVFSSFLIMIQSS
jgi:hypothetical protein